MRFGPGMEEEGNLGNPPTVRGGRRCRGGPRVTVTGSCFDNETANVVVVVSPSSNLNGT